MALRNQNSCLAGGLHRWIVAGMVVLALPGGLFAQGLLDSLAKPIPGRSMRSTSTFRKGADGKYDPNADPLGAIDEPISNRDARDLPPGQTQVVLDVQGPGVITHIWFTFRGPEQGGANHQEMLVRMYWDGAEKPAVEAPMGDFFANAFGFRREIISLPVVVEDADSYNCYWHMPFRKSARIEVINQSDKPIKGLYHNIDWIKLDTLAEDTPYFYAQYRQEYPTTDPKDYVLLETQGKGHYVGTVLAVRMRSPAWFGEGDEKIYIDGETKPSIWGTGTEDYFLSAWGLKPCKTPYFGVPYFKQRGVGTYTSSYRWHLCDPIVFNTGIKVTIEHMGWMSEDENKDYKAMSWNVREDDYASVAFWYQTGPSTFTARAPDGPARKLPSLDKTIVYAKDFTEAKFHGVGQARPQPMAELLYPQPQLLYKPESPDGAWVEIPFKVTTKEPVRLLINATCAPDFGRYQASLNGVKLGRPLDFYAEQIDSNEFHLLDFWPEPGDYVLRLECVGKKAISEGYGMGLESVRLRERRPRVTQMAHDKDKDWREHPRVYR